MLLFAYGLSQINLIWRNGFGAEHMTSENVLTLRFLICNKRIVLPPHGILMILRWNHLCEVFVD